MKDTFLINEYFKAVEAKDIFKRDIIFTQLVDDLTIDELRELLRQSFNCVDVIEEEVIEEDKNAH